MVRNFKSRQSQIIYKLLNCFNVHVLFPEFGSLQTSSLHVQNYKSEQQFCEQ